MAPSYSRIGRRRFLTIAGVGLAALPLACVADAEPGDTPTATSTATRVPTTATPVPSPTPVPAATLDEMIGQMLLVGFRGDTLQTGSTIYNDLTSGRAGNVVLFDVNNGNITSPSQVAALTAAIQKAAPGTVLIAADQEGGLVTRLDVKHGFSAQPSAASLGAQNDAAKTRAAGVAAGTTLANAGVNLNLAPVVDVNVNPDNPVIGGLDRSFSADPEAVAVQAGAFIEGQHTKGILTTLKHFPGHGSSEADSHLGFVDVTDTWSEQELIPYRRLIAAGSVDTIMTAHIFNAHLDPDYPATLSHATITGLLREQLGYNGVILTDDMQMGAISQFFGFQRAIELAINAGADIISIANTLVFDAAASTRGFEAIKAAVDAGRIRAARVHESYARIMALKARLT